MTDGSGITIADSDKLAISDGGTEKFVLASNIKSYIEGSTLNITGSLSVNGGIINAFSAQAIETG